MSSTLRSLQASTIALGSRELVTANVESCTAPDSATKVAKLVRPGGVFLHGDNMKFSPQLPSLQKIAKAVRDQQRQDETFAQLGVESWAQWWAALGQEPALTDLLAERERRFAWRSPDNWVNAGRDLQMGALHEAGFQEVGIIWQRFDNCVLMAVR